MKDVLQLDLPWLTLRSKLVQEDDQGILYNTMFEGYDLDNSKLRMVRNIEHYIITIDNDTFCLF